MNYTSKPHNNFTDVIYPGELAILNNNMLNDASLVLIDGVIVYASKQGIDILRAKISMEITGMRWSSFLNSVIRIS